MPCLTCTAYEICLKTYEKTLENEYDVIIVPTTGDENEYNHVVQVVRSCNKKYLVLPLTQKSGCDTPTKAVLDNCNSMFYASLDKCNAKLIITVGRPAFVRIVQGINYADWAGRSITHKIENKKYSIIPVFASSSGKTDKKKGREVIAQLSNLECILNGKNDTTLANKKYALITEEKDIIDYLEFVSSINKPQAFDWETTHLDPHKGTIVCMNHSIDKDVAACLYFFDIDEWRSRKTSSKQTPFLKLAFRKWLLSNVPKVAHHAKFEIKHSSVCFGVEPNNIIACTKQMFHVIKEDEQTGLKDLAYRYSNMGGYDAPMQKFLDSGHEHWEASPEMMRVYGCGDADATLQVYNNLNPKLDFILGMRWLYDNIVLPATYTLARMELRGMKVNKTTATNVQKYIEDTINTINYRIKAYPEVKETEAHFRLKDKKYAGLNLGSHRQVKYLLYTACRCPVINTSKKSGEPSTDADTLEELKHRHPVISDIVQMRSLSYQLTDLQGVLANIRSDSTTYSNLIQDYVVTGRLSSRDPNLQNIKGENEEERSFVKECFISRYGDAGCLLQADYSQLELNFIANESKEPSWIDAFYKNWDMHALTASKVYNIPIETIMGDKEKYKPQRTVGKRLNFGTVYGITEHGLSKQLKCSVPEAKDYLDMYWQQYPTIAEWMRSNVKFAKKYKFVQSRSGRVRHLPNIDSTQWWLRDGAERQASNFRIQCLGADVTMFACVNIDQRFEKAYLRSKVIGQIHDSILVDVYPTEQKQVIEIMRDVMVNLVTKTFNITNIQIKIDIETGNTWSNMKKLKGETV
jgi:DNA polymerase I-like protein with 3'-5' exonuclease and polymerase domains